MRSFISLLAFAALNSSVFARPYASTEERMLLRERRRLRMRRAGPSAVSNAGQPLITSTSRNIVCPAPTTDSGSLQLASINYDYQGDTVFSPGGYLACTYANGPCNYNAGTLTPIASSSGTFCGDSSDQASGGTNKFTTCPGTFMGASATLIPDGTGIQLPNGQLGCSYGKNAFSSLTCIYDSSTSALTGAGALSGNNNYNTPAAAEAAGCASSSIDNGNPGSYYTPYQV